MLADTLKFMSCVAVSLSLFYSRGYCDVRGLFRGETFVLTLFALLGMMVMIAAGSFVTLYLGLELLALSLYAMVAMYRTSNAASEAAMKYFVLGALASGILLYGMSMIYGATGSLDIATVVAKSLAAERGNRTMLLFGLVFVVSGIAFKLGAVPYHMWVPDVYDGAPTAMTLLIGTAPKLAAFAFMLRLLGVALGGLWFDWQGMLIILALLSMVFGNVVAIAQTNIKRMLAYSSIANMGFLLMGFLAANPNGYSAAMFYAIAYVLTSLASFGMIMLLSRDGFEADQDRGLQGPQPAFALVGIHDASRHVLAGGHSADRRFLCEIHRDPGGGGRGLRVAGGGRRHGVARRRVLLPSRRQADVFRRRDRYGADRRPGRQSRTAVGQRPRAPRLRHSAAAAARAVRRRARAFRFALNSRPIAPRSGRRGHAKIAALRCLAVTPRQCASAFSSPASSI